MYDCLKNYVLITIWLIGKIKKVCAFRKLVSTETYMLVLVRMLPFTESTSDLSTLDSTNNSLVSLNAGMVMELFDKFARFSRLE